MAQSFGVIAAYGNTAHTAIHDKPVWQVGGVDRRPPPSLKESACTFLGDSAITRHANHCARNSWAIFPMDCRSANTRDEMLKLG